MSNPPDFFNEKEDKINNRFDEILKWLETYVKYSREYLNRNLQFRGEKTSYDVALAINTAYWKRYQKIFPDHVKKENGDSTNIRHEKILSGIELSIIDIQPFYSDNENDSLSINTDFALFTSINILRTWNDIPFKSYNDILEADKELQNFLDDHRTWLINLQTDLEYPVYLNSQVWALFIKILKIKLSV